MSSTFQKLSWPLDEGAELEGEPLQKSPENSTPCNKTSHKKTEREHVEERISFPEGDESNEDYLEGSQPEADSDGEEPPVLPKVPVKRKLVNEARACERRNQRGRPKSASPQMKKQKTPNIDASVIVQLDFGARPENCVSKETLSTQFTCIVDSINVVQFECNL